MPDRAGNRPSAAERIRADLLACLAERGSASRDELVRDVRGRTESILATLRDLAAEGFVRVTARGYASLDAPVEVEPWQRLEARCCRYGHRDYTDDGGQAVALPRCEGAPVEGCATDLWALAGRPMPVPGWEAAGRPDRAGWAAQGGLCSYDDIDGDMWADADCPTAGGAVEAACLRPACYDCHHAAGEWGAWPHGGPEGWSKVRRRSTWRTARRARMST